MSTATYRWNADQAARDYDVAAPVIHPRYEAVQDAVMESIAGVLDRVERPHVIDLGGGSGRLAERILGRWPTARVTLVEPSKAFGRLADERLARFGGRYQRLTRGAQDRWVDAVEPADAVVSTSALHHLDADDKNQAFAACRAALRPGGVLVNGDEYRPPSDTAYRAMLEAWGDHMTSAVASGEIPATFGEIIDRWRDRNLLGFGGPRETGDDCHETTEEQVARLYGAGFGQVRIAWRDRLWAVLEAA